MKQVAGCEVHQDAKEQFDMEQDGKMFYDEVHTDEVQDQMTARVEKAVRTRENMATKKDTGTGAKKDLIFSSCKVPNGAMLQNL